MSNLNDAGKELDTLLKKGRARVAHTTTYDVKPVLDKKEKLKSTCKNLGDKC